MASEGPPIWMFHRVMPDEPTSFGMPSCFRLRGTAVTEEEFTAFLDGLEGTSTLAEVLDGEARHPVLTFDDGYREWVDVVAPALRKRGLTAMFFGAPVFSAGAAGAYAIDVLYWLFDHAEKPVLRVVDLDGVEHLGRLDSAEGKRALVTGPLKRGLYSADSEAAGKTLERVEEALGVESPSDLADRLYPSRAEWSALAREFAVGGHGTSHRVLPSLGDADLRVELEGTMAWVRDVGGERILSYPDGQQDARVRLAAREAGFRGAVAIGYGDAPRGELFALGRVFGDLRGVPAPVQGRQGA